MIINITFHYRGKSLVSGFPDVMSGNLQAYEEDMAKHLFMALRDFAAANGLPPPTASKKADEPWEPAT